jgi:hypothetical protein
MRKIDERVIDRGIDRFYWEKVLNRIKHGIGWETAELCMLPGIGPVKAISLMADYDIHSIEEFVKKRKVIQAFLGKRVFKKAYDKAKELI